MLDHTWDTHIMSCHTHLYIKICGSFWVLTVVWKCVIWCLCFAGNLSSFPAADPRGSLPPWQTWMPWHRTHVWRPHRPAQNRLQHVHEGQTLLTIPLPVCMWWGHLWHILLTLLLPTARCGQQSVFFHCLDMTWFDSLLSKLLMCAHTYTVFTQAGQLNHQKHPLSNLHF